MNKKPLGIALVLAALVITAVVFSLFSGKQNKLPDSTLTPSPSSPLENIPEDYVTLLDNKTHEARFLFKTALDENKIRKENIKVCVESASVANTGEISCEDEGKYEIKYDAVKKILTVSETNILPEDKDKMGIFGTGCASCMHQAEFSGLVTPHGQILPKKVVSVY